MLELQHFTSALSRALPEQILKMPWSITRNMDAIISEKIKSCGDDFTVTDNIAIHNSAKVEAGAVLKGPIWISENCFIAAHAYLRAGVFLDRNVTIGPGCEVKSSIILERSTLAHFNFVGDSIIGSNVNFEAGAIIANHHNDRENKEIFVAVDNVPYATGSQKFGALVGDFSKIGANAVLSPGTILPRHTIIARLALVKQY